MLRAGGVAALGAVGALAVTGGASAARTASNGSVLDKWVKSKKARLGVDLTFPPLQFIDPKTKKPSGYIVELTELMMSDLGVKPEWVQTPFAQLFAALAAGKFDMIGIAATILPSPGTPGLLRRCPRLLRVERRPGEEVVQRAQRRGAPDGEVRRAPGELAAGERRR